MTKENKARLAHLLGFLFAVGSAVIPSWADPQQTWQGALAVTIVVGLLLGIGTDNLKSQRNAILAGLAMAATVAAFVLGKFTAGTAGFAIAGGVAAVLAQVRAMLTRELADDATDLAQPQIENVKPREPQPDTTPTKPAV